MNNNEEYFITTITKPKITVVYFFKVPNAIERLKRNGTLPTIAKTTCKDYINDYINENENALKGKLLQTNYITDDGIVNGRNKKIEGNANLRDMKNVLLADPVADRDDPSDKYNNILQGKRIMGVSLFITTLSHKPESKKKGFKTWVK